MKLIFWYLCCSLDCEHYFNEFMVTAIKKPIGYVTCPKCGCSSEENGLGGDKLINRMSIGDKNVK